MTESTQSAQVTRRPRRRRPQAGKRLRERLDDALKHARRELGQPLLELTEHELEAVERACASADRAEELRWLYDEELRGEERRPSILTKLSGEIRLLDRQVVDLLARVKFGVGDAKSERHAYSANQRWHQGGGA